MTDKTLTDELRSVLLFHALEAPEPNATVDRILAETVGPVTALGLYDETSASGAEPRPSRRLSLQHLMAAAVVAVLLISVAGINSARNRNAARTATEASQDQVNQRQGGAVAASGSTAGSAPLPGAGEDNSFEAKPVAPPAYVGKRLDCSTIPGSKITLGQSEDFALLSDVEGSLFEYLCLGPDGRRSASEVQMFHLVDGKWKYERSLPHPNAYEHLESMTAGQQALVQFSVHSPGGVPGEIRAAVVDLSDPSAVQSYSVAEPCLREHLEVTLTPVPAAAAPSWRLSLRNRTEGACALEGFPRVLAQRDGATLTTAALTLNGPAGGVTRQKVPPIIVLTRGATASAVIEQSSRSAAGSCVRSDQLAVTLPNGVSLGQLPAEVAGCGLVVHPLVGNARGSD
jgi:hypothetical protein